MTEKVSILLENEKQGHAALLSIWKLAKAHLSAQRRMLLTLAPETRTAAQNRLMWPLLTEFSRQLQWPVNGQMVNMPPDDWKAVLSAAFNQESARLAMGLSGGVVMLGQRTRKFTKLQFSEWIEFLQATAAMRGVVLPVWDQEQTKGTAC